jgi:hypothetical protein
MNQMAKKELIKEIKPRYIKASKEEKKKILDEFCKSTRYNRKYAITILQAKFDNDRIKNEGRKKRKSIYANPVITTAIKVWEILDFPCGARLKPQLLPMIEALERHKEISVVQKVKNLLKRISAKTLDRKLKRERQIRRLDRSRGMTCRGTLLKSSIPIRITNWDTAKLGFAETDTVAHNGGDPSGEFIYSLDVVEIYSGWSEQFAVMGKGEQGVVNAFEKIEIDLPFDLLGLDSDSGSEFINWHLVRHCKERKMLFTRSRPDRKNDNAYIEEKNNSRVRKLLGFGRFDTMEQLAAINDLYRNELRLYNNFFLPVMKIISKEKINNSVCRKKYDEAKTPCQRLMACPQLSLKRKSELKKLYLSLNPVKLKNEIDKKIKKIKSMQK